LIEETLGVLIDVLGENHRAIQKLSEERDQCRQSLKNREKAKAD
jgi:hypothetical protein